MPQSAAPTPKKKKVRLEELTKGVSVQKEELVAEFSGKCNFQNAFQNASFEIRPQRDQQELVE